MDTETQRHEQRKGQTLIETDTETETQRQRHRDGQRHRHGDRGRDRDRQTAGEGGPRSHGVVCIGRGGGGCRGRAGGF